MSLVRAVDQHCTSKKPAKAGFFTRKARQAATDKQRATVFDGYNGLKQHAARFVPL